MLPKFSLHSCSLLRQTHAHIHISHTVHTYAHRLLHAYVHRINTTRVISKSHTYTSQSPSTSVSHAQILILVPSSNLDSSHVPHELPWEGGGHCHHCVGEKDNAVWSTFCDLWVSWVSWELCEYWGADETLLFPLYCHHTYVGFKVTFQENGHSQSLEDRGRSPGKYLLSVTWLLPASTHKCCYLHKMKSVKIPGWMGHRLPLLARSPSAASGCWGVKDVAHAPVPSPHPCAGGQHKSDTRLVIIIKEDTKLGRRVPQGGGGRYWKMNMIEICTYIECLKKK